MFVVLVTRSLQAMAWLGLTTVGVLVCVGRPLVSRLRRATVSGATGPFLWGYCVVCLPFRGCGGLLLLGFVV